MRRPDLLWKPELDGVVAGLGGAPPWNRLPNYRPYPKQHEFHEAGAGHRERLLMAGNQLGKTTSGAAEIAIYLTGHYPAWWTGRRFDRPVRIWAGSKTVEVARDCVQRMLIGEPKDESQWGSGLIPREAIRDRSRRQGVSDALDGVVVRHASGANSTLAFKSYDQGREKWQGETLDVVWFDEEPPLDIYMEGLTRTNATEGMVFMTFTPLLGMSEVVSMFLEGEVPAFRKVVQMTIDDAEHFSAEQRDRIIASYPEHEREARVKGFPSLGSGRVFRIAEEAIVVDPFEAPSHWPQINGLDYGWNHPFAAVNMWWNRDADCTYITNEYSAREETPITHAAAIKPWGEWIPNAWPHDGLAHEKGTGEALRDFYQRQGLNMLVDHATFADGSMSVEAGVLDVLERMRTGRWKVFRSCGGWLGEFRVYHRKNGLIVKTKDDAISASRYALMMLRFAITKPAPRLSGGRRGEFYGVGDWMR